MNIHAGSAPELLDPQPRKSRICYYEVSLKPGALWKAALPSGKATELHGRDSSELGCALALCLELFQDHWAQITFGPCIRGAIYELQLAAKPEVFVHDGYVIVDLGAAGHLHLCIASFDPTAACARIALFAGYTEVSDEPVSWGIRFWNGAGQQMLSVFMTAAGSAERDEHGIPVGLQADERAVEIWQQLRARYC